MIIPTLFPFPLYYHFRCLRPPDTCPTLSGLSPTCRCYVVVIAAVAAFDIAVAIDVAAATNVSSAAACS